MLLNLGKIYFAKLFTGELTATTYKIAIGTSTQTEDVNVTSLANEIDSRLATIVRDNDKIYLEAIYAAHEFNGTTISEVGIINGNDELIFYKTLSPAYNKTNENLKLRFEIVFE